MRRNGFFDLDRHGRQMEAAAKVPGIAERTIRVRSDRRHFAGRENINARTEILEPHPQAAVASSESAIEVDESHVQARSGIDGDTRAHWRHRLSCHIGHQATPMPQEISL
jgi:hypothetical protein